ADIGESDLQIEILRDRAIDERVEHGIAESPPPRFEIGGRRHDSGLVALAPSVWHRECGRAIVRADGASLDADQKHEREPAADTDHDGADPSMNTSSC